MLHQDAEELQHRSQGSSRSRRSLACNYCRLKKIRCNRDDRRNGTPCANCVDRGQRCVLSAHDRTRTRAAAHQDTVLEDRLARLETLLAHKSMLPVGIEARNRLQGQEASSAPVHLSGSLSPFVAGTHTPPLADGASSGTPLDFHAAAFTNLPDTETPVEQSHCWRTPGTLTTPSQRMPTRSTSHGLIASEHSITTSSGNDTAYPQNDLDESQDNSSVPSGELSNWEYHGPTSFLSICSRSAVEWISQKTGCITVSSSAQKFVTYVTRRLKMEMTLSKACMSLPDWENAWKFTEAYFENALDASLCLVHRPWFVTQLKAHFDGTVDDSDPAWRALRNAVFASGCRIELSKSQSFATANQQAWHWFEQALAAHTELLYFRTSLMGVQALTVMAYFTQNFSSPCLEYMLCANAFRLAIAKGLHRQPAVSWCLSQQEIDQRNCLFWAIYCLEKQIVCQSGRPSIIDDDSINCKFPTTTPLHNDGANVEYFTTLIKLAQIVSNMSKHLSRIQISLAQPESLMGPIHDLDDQLNAIKHDMEPIWDRRALIECDGLAKNMRRRQSIYLQFVYFSAVLYVHTPFTCPWDHSILTHLSSIDLRETVAGSAHIVAVTCRAAIIALDRIYLEASTPVTLSFFGPAYALIHLFVHILQNPTHAGIESDLALMDVGAGFFARFRYNMGHGVSFCFIKELAALAHEAVRKTENEGGDGVVDVGRQPQHSLTSTPLEVRGRGDFGHTVENQQSSYAQSNQAVVGECLDIELEAWDTFLSATPYEGDH